MQQSYKKLFIVAAFLMSRVWFSVVGVQHIVSGNGIRMWNRGDCMLSLTLTYFETGGKRKCRTFDLSTNTFRDMYYPLDVYDLLLKVQVYYSVWSKATIYFIEVPNEASHVYIFVGKFLSTEPYASYKVIPYGSELSDDDGLNYVLLSQPTGTATEADDSNPAESTKKTETAKAKPANDANKT